MHEDSVRTITEKLHHIQNVDRLLPSQPVLSQMFVGDAAEFFRSMETLLLSVLPVKSIHEKWDIKLKNGVSYASFGSDLGTLHFYQLLIRLGRIKTVLELGTFVGVSTLFLAEAVGEDGHVTTVELGNEFHALATGNFKRNPIGDRITLIKGCAMETLKQQGVQRKKYDMIIIDAAKESYAEMLQPALDCLAAGGLLLVDDIFFQGDTLNKDPTSEKGLGIRKLLERVPRLASCYTKVILPIGNGLLLIHVSRSEGGI